MTSLSVSYAQALWGRAERAPHDELLRVAGSQAWTAVQVRVRAASWALELSSFVARGEVVVTCVDAGPDAVALTAAISALGGIEFPLSPDADIAWSQSLLDTASAQVIVSSCSRASGALVRELARPQHRRLALIDGPSALRPERSDADSFVPAALAPGDPALIVTTSGTTGHQKAALLPVGAPIRQARRVADTMQYGTGDVLLSLFPWHHINARNAAALPAIISGARVVFAPRFSASRFWNVVHREQITAVNFMGAVCMMLLRQPATRADSGHSLTKAYGGPAPAELLHSFKKRFGVTLRQAYACTELGDISTTGLNELSPGAAGRPLDDREVRIVDGALQDVPDGTTGDILVRPTDSDTILIEYVGNPDASSTAWMGEWFATHDRGYLTDGWLTVTGRASDVIRRRGINLDPQRIEESLESHPGVAEAAAVAVPSDLTEDEVLALVVLADESAVTVEELWRHCAQTLPRPHVPRYLSLQYQLPHTSTHKLDRAALRLHGLPANTWEATGDRTSQELR